jgi:hypothetical protein
MSFAPKWLNLRAFCELAFPGDHVKDLHYFTARIKPNPHDPDKHVRQDTYFRALKTVPVSPDDVRRSWHVSQAGGVVMGSA